MGIVLMVMGMGVVCVGVEIDCLFQVVNIMFDQFQCWLVGVKFVGIEQEKFGDILKDVNDWVGDFVQIGGGLMVDFFEKIVLKVGVMVKEFCNFFGVDVFQFYVLLLEKVNVNQQDFMFYMEVMVFDSMLFLFFLKNGGVFMLEYGDWVQCMGVILSGLMFVFLCEGKGVILEM